ncbi:AAA family ATPase [Roseateles flavus]|uniref:AAA family ATPase n=1 Tax=Roseateles flavus TaxID=3149041 RepID=A0ABV0GL98_9BURK
MPTFQFFFSTSLEDTLALDGYHLLQDHVGGRYAHAWDDFDYIVTFQIQRVTKGKREFFGRTKVLIRGVKDTSKHFIANGLPRGKSFEIGKLLHPDSAVSLAADLDYYQRLAKDLQDSAEDFLRQICDASYFSDRYNIYSQWNGFDVSLLRGGSTALAIVNKGRYVAAGRYVPKSDFQFNVAGLTKDFEPIKFRFDKERKIGNTNVNLLIGRNGSGKSHVLRHVVDQVTGVLPCEDKQPYFHKVVVAAYSPFESFKTENQLSAALGEETRGDEALEKMSQRRLMVNKYAYIGFRDPGGSFSLDWPKESSAHALLKILAYDEESSWRAMSRFELLFNTLKQSINFDFVALKDKGGQPILLSAAENFVQPSAASVVEKADVTRGIFFLKQGADTQQPLPVLLSSGQTIYSYLLPNLVAEVEEESLVILDEPELYLHPAMEIGLINMVKTLLEVTKSNAIIATHSSILAREVERLGVVVLRREEERTTSTPPPVETFGQSVELIMGEVFDDYHVRKTYQKSLDAAAKPYASPQMALEGLAGSVGDEALAYLASRLDSGVVTVELRTADDAEDPEGQA